MNQFEIPQNLEPMENIIKVVGVGGGGSNAVKHLYQLNVKNVDFIVCNTDKQHLLSSPIPNKIQLGKNVTKGLGAGCKPEKGREAAIESKEEIKRVLEQNTEMLFIAAGLGGGTGTGAAPIVAEVARSLGILTVAIVTLPFKFEGKKKMEYALMGLEELKKNVDSIIIIPNEKLKEIYLGMKMNEAFAKADEVVATAAKSIAEIITNNLHINVDFNDVRTVMQNSGTALMGTAIARGKDRAIQALKNAINHPLLINNSIEGAKHILLSITTGSEDITTDEFEAITTYIEEASGGTAEVIPGYGNDESLGDAVSITIVATGFESQDIFEFLTISSNTSNNVFTTVSEVKEVPLNTNNPSDGSSNDTNLDTIPTSTEEPCNNTNTFRIESISSTDNHQNNSESIEPNLEFQLPSNQNDLINNVDTNTINNLEKPIENKIKENIHPIELPSDSSSNPSIVKIIDKNKDNENESSTNTDDTSKINVIDDLNKNIKIISEHTSKLRKQILDWKDPNVYQELENIPAYLRKKQNTNIENKPTNTLGKDHSNQVIDEKGNIRPGNPYLNDQVD